MGCYGGVCEVQRRRDCRREVAGEQCVIEPAAQEVRPQELGERFILLGIATGIAQGAR